ncbi:MAG TPA: condensation domain-containing protein, partial [Pyrinomonadaceae bacterium]|nr:condensation domain-containing protein [Pyrinomonadaceae bacterium]
MTQIASLSFDAAGWELWPALCAGGRVEVVPEGVRASWEELGRWMREQEVTVCFLPTPVAEEMLNAGVELPASLRLLSVGGDRLRRWAEAGAHYELANIYGPTEITIASNCGMVAATGAGLPPLGHAIANTQVYVLDPSGELCPVGVAGELYVGGAGVARGYVQRPELTAERFVPDRFSGRAGARLYRTGDVVSWRADGQLDFIGRLDAQVKLRGHRIELGEIEAVLSKFACVRQCAVAILELAGTQMLTAYFVGDAEAPLLREHAARQLPAYMIPQRFIRLEALPLTPNGKLDRKALPAPEATDFQLFAEPQTPTQEILCGIWAEVLGRERVGIHDNFFELGGDSILSIQVVARAAQYGLSLTTRDLFERQTVALLSEAAGGETATQAQSMQTGEVPLTPIQHWFMRQERRRPWHFNHAVLLADAKKIDGARLQRAVERVLASHEVFHLRYERDGQGQVRQHYRSGDGGDSHARRCGRVDLRALHRTAQSKLVESVAERVQESLDLEAGRLVAAVRFEVSDSGDVDTGADTDGGRLLVVAHHLAIDGVSWRILLDQVERAYADLQTDTDSTLRTQGSSFGQWALALEREARSEETQRELAYWVKQQPCVDERVPRDFEAGANTVESSESVAVEFDAEQTEVLLREVPRRLRAQVEEVLMLGVVEALREWSGSREAVVECEGHGREPLAGVDVSQTVGWFTTLYPVRFVRESEGEATIAERLREVRDQLRAVPRKGLGYGLLKYCAGAEQLSVPEAEVSFNYLGQWDANLGGLFTPGAESVGASQWAGERRSHVVGVNGSVHGGRLRMVWTYSRNVHRRETVERVAGLFRQTVEAVVAACAVENEAAAPAPVEVSDLSFSDAEWKALLTAVRS